MLQRTFLGCLQVLANVMVEAEGDGERAKSSSTCSCVHLMCRNRCTKQTL